MLRWVDYSSRHPLSWECWVLRCLCSCRHTYGRDVDAICLRDVALAGVLKWYFFVHLSAADVVIISRRSGKPTCTPSCPSKVSAQGLLTKHFEMPVWLTNDNHCLVELCLFKVDIWPLLSLHLSKLYHVIDDVVSLAVCTYVGWLSVAFRPQKL